MIEFFGKWKTWGFWTIKRFSALDQAVVTLAALGVAQGHILFGITVAVLGSLGVIYATRNRVSVEE